MFAALLLGHETLESLHYYQCPCLIWWAEQATFKTNLQFIALATRLGIQPEMCPDLLATSFIFKDTG